MQNLCQYFSGHVPQRFRRSHESLGAACGLASYKVRACSSCAGDYEDPDRTARPTDLEKEEGEGESELRIQVEDSCNADEKASARNTGADHRESFPAQ